MNKYFLYTASLILLCASKVSAQVIPYEEPSSFPVDTQYIEQLNRKARASRHIETESGIRLYQEAFMRSHQIGYVDGIARALTGLGLFHMDKGEYAKSAMYYEYAEPFCEASKDGILLVSLYNNKAALYGNRGLSDSAVTYYYRALNLAEKRNLRDTNVLLLIYSNLGGRLAASGQAEQAAFYLDRGVAISKAKNNLRMLAKFYKDLGIMYGSRKEGQLSRKYSFMAIDLLKKVMDPPSEIATYCNIGLSYLEEGRPVKALHYYQIAANDSFKASIVQKLGAIKGIGASYLALKRFDLAEQYYRQALEVSTERRITKNRMDCYKALVAVYTGKGDLQKALAFRDVYETIKDSLQNAERSSRVQQLEVEYRTAQKDRELAEKQLLLQQREHKLQRQNRTLAFLAGSTVLLLALGAAIYANRKNRRRIQLLQAEKEQEIGRLVATMEGEEKERRRIAQELHDGIMVQYSAAQLNLSALIEQADSQHQAKVEEVLVQLEKATRELRTSAHNLMPDMLLNEGLAEATHYFLCSVQQSTGLQIEFQIIGTLPSVSHNYELMLYRIIQELIQNVIKHAKAGNVLVQINSQHGLLSIAVEDDGIGLADSGRGKHSGMGLSAIRSRIKSLNGTITINSTPGHGTSVYLELEESYLQSPKDATYAYQRDNS